MSDVGYDPNDWLRRASQVQQPLSLNGSPIGPPQGIPGAFPGVLSSMGAQGAPAVNSGPQPGLLNALNPWATLKRLDPYPAYQANKAKGDFPGWGQVLNPLSDWNFQRFQANKAAGGEGPAESAPMAPAVSPPASPQQAASIPPMPSDPNNPMPRVSAPSMVQPPEQPLAPPTVASVPQPPQQMPAIPPASPAGRVNAAQGQSSPLDQYFQQLMALQRQRMLLGMAGGLLGAPTLGIGLGRAFTNAAESVAPQGDLVSKIAGAQAAGQLTAQQPHSTKEDVQASILQGLFGKPFEPPKFEKYEHGTFGIKPGGRMYDTTTGYSTWVHGHIGLDHSGKPVPVSQAATADLGNGHTAVLLDDRKWHDAYHPTEEGSER